MISNEITSNTNQSHQSPVAQLNPHVTVASPWHRQVVLQRLARPERRLAPSLRRASAAVDAAGRSLERWVRGSAAGSAAGPAYSSGVHLQLRNSW